MNNGLKSGLTPGHLLAVVICLGASPASAQAVKERLVLFGHTDAVRAVAFSPDGKTLASASNDKSVRLWDVATGREVAIPMGHTNGVTCLAFTPDGKTLAAYCAPKPDHALERRQPQGHGGVESGVALPGLQSRQQDAGRVERED